MAEAVEADGEVRDGAWVAEITDHVDLSAWPEGSRVIVRAEQPHPDVQLSIFDAETGLRHSAFIFAPRPGDGPDRRSVAELELRHRRHARVEDRIRQAKAMGLRNLPCKEVAENHVWLECVLAATDLVAWSKLICFYHDPDLAHCEIANLRYRITHTAARIIRTGRVVYMKLDRTWAWTKRSSFRSAGRLDAELGVIFNLGTIYRRAGDIRGLGVLLERAEEIWSQTAKAEALALVCIGRAVTAQLNGASPKAIAELAAIPAGSLQGDWLAQVDMVRGTNLLLSGHTEESIRSLESAAASPTPAIASVAYDLLASTRGVQGRRPEAIADARRAVAFAAQDGSRLAGLLARANLALMLAADGAKLEARTLVDFADTTDSLPEGEPSARVMIAKALLAIEDGDHDEARAVLRLAGQWSARPVLSSLWAASLETALLRERRPLWEDLARQTPGFAAPVEAGLLAAQCLDERSAMNKLRVTLSYLLDGLEPDRLRHSRRSVLTDVDGKLHLGPAGLRVDVWEARSAVEDILDADETDARSVRAAGRRLLESWGGPLVADGAFGDWIEPSRWHLHQQALRACLKDAAASLSAGDLRQVERLSELATTLDPWSDRAFELLARAQLVGGDRDAARRTLSRLVMVLEQIGVQPGPPLQTLARRAGLALR